MFEIIYTDDIMVGDMTPKRYNNNASLHTGTNNFMSMLSVVFVELRVNMLNVFLRVSLYPSIGITMQNSIMTLSILFLYAE